MQRKTGYWKFDNSIKLFYRLWFPKQKPKAIILLLHGLGEHSGRYRELAEFLVDNQYALLAYDNIGHGKSGGKRGHAASYKALMDAINKGLEEMQKLEPDTPRVLYGHSWGGNLALNFLLRRQPELTAAIITSPWLKLAFDPPKWKLLLGKWMNTVWPSFSQPNGLNAEELSHDITVVESYKIDPLCHNRISAGLFYTSREAAQWALQHADRLPVLTFLMHGISDSITDVEGSRIFAEKAGKKLLLKTWPDLYHELHHETIKAEVFHAMQDFLAKVLPLSDKATE